MDFEVSLVGDITAFSLVVLAVWQFHRFFARGKLPLISVYLFTGMVAETFILRIDDQADYEGCELACCIFAVSRIVFRIKEISGAQEFLALGAVVINPGFTMVNSLDQSVRSPEPAAVILHQNSNNGLRHNG